MENSKQAREPADWGLPDSAVFRRAADCLADGVAIAGLDGQISYANPAMSYLFGYDEAELPGQHLKTLLADEAQVELALTQVMEQCHWETTDSARRRNGFEFRVRHALSRVDDADGTPTAVLIVSRDVTEEEAFHSGMERRTEQLRDLLDAGREINSALDRASVMKLLVRHAMNLVGADAGMVGAYVDDKMVFDEYQTAEKTLPLNYSFHRSYGVPGWVIEHHAPYISNDAAGDPQVIRHIQKELGFERLINTPVIASDGRLLGCFELHRTQIAQPFTDEDVSLLAGLANQAAVALANAGLAENLNEILQALRDSEESLRLVVEGSPDFFFYIHDANGMFTYLSPSVETITGHSVDQWKSHYTRFLTDSPDNDAVVRHTEAAVATGEPSPPYPVEIRHKDGRRITLEVYERPIFEHERVVGIRGVARDVTELRQTEEAEATLRAESEAHKRKFYRDTIMSVTDGKLIVTDTAEIEALCADPLFPSVEITEPRDIAIARDEVRSSAIKAGMDEGLADDLVLCIGEAATNAYKHAGGGTVCVSDAGSVLRVAVCDHGPGMDSLALPKLTLLRGYSARGSLGMGYATILGLADKVYLSTGPEGTKVAVEMAKRPRAAALRLADLPDLW